MAITAPHTVDQQVAWERARRPLLGGFALASGALFLISGVIDTVTLRNAPTVSVVQGLAPALRGQANPAESPKVPEVRFITHHAAGLISSSAVAGLSVLLLMVVLLFLYDAARHRRPETTPVARPLILVGGVGYAVLAVANQVVNAVNTHNFIHGRNHSNHAVDQALTSGTGHLLAQYLGLITSLALAVGLVVVALNSMRTGLLSRFMGVLGFLVAFMLVVPLGPTLGIVQVFWLLALGVLLLGRWPNGDPPAWAAGEARPWPTQAELREQRAAEAGGAGARRGGRAERPAPAKATSVEPAGAGQAPPEPSAPVRSSSRRRKRKRGGR